MLNRWLKFAQAGVFGLLLVSFSVSGAYAASLRQGNHPSEPTVMFGLADPTGSTPSAVPGFIPAVQEFSDGGAGVVNLITPSSVCIAAGLICNTGDFCQCVRTTGTVNDGVGPVFSGIPFVFLLNVDLSSHFDDGNNVGRFCFGSTGILSFIASPSAQLNFNTAGAACNSTGVGVALYSGGFLVGASTGGFSNASGAGMIGFGGNSSTSVGTFDLRGAGSNLN
jgi:hypothetical protein